jgi:hypothetical protein
MRGVAIGNLAVKIVAVGLAVYPLVDPNASHFQGKAMGVRAFVYPLATLLIPAAWWLRGRPSPYPYLADVALAFPFAFDAAGNVFGWFAISGFDVAPHFLGWASLAICFGSAVGPIVNRRWTTFGLVVGFGATIDILWEIGEFLLSRSGSSGLQLTYENTIQDLAMSLLGATAGAIIVSTALRPRLGAPAGLFGWARRTTSATA